jgi:hypothetical protein
LHAEGIKAESGNGAYVANAGFALPSCTGGEVDLLEKSQLANEFLCLRIGLSPVARAFCPAISR